MDGRDEGGVLRVIEKEICENKEIKPKGLSAIETGGHRGQFREQRACWVAP